MLFPISLEPSVPYQFLIELKSKRWDSCIGFPSLVFPYGERDYFRPSFDMDCLLAVWALWLLVSLVTCEVWSFDLYLKKLPYNMVYITHTEFNKAPLFHQRLGSLCPSLSLFLADALKRRSWLHNPGNINLFPSFTFLSLTLDHQVPVQLKDPNMKCFSNKNSN